MSVGYIGLGQMGAAMAGHLAAGGTDLVVHDLNDAAVRVLTDAGASSATSAADVARSAMVISTCVPAAAHLDAVVDGPDGLFAGARPGTTLLVHSTVHPDTIASLAERGAAHGVDVYDACVAGGGTAASEGDLVIFAGGLSGMAPAARELLGIYGSRVIDAGPIGAGAALKIAVNVMTYSQFAAAKTAFEIVGGAGGDTGALVDAWRHTGQLGTLTEQFLPMLSLSASDVVGGMRDYLLGTVGIAQKDLELAAELGAGGAESLAGVIAAVAAAMPTTFNLEEN